MVAPSPAPCASSQFDALKSFVRRHRIPVAIILIAVLAAFPILVYYAMSYNSVNGTTVQLATGYRSQGEGYVTTFYLEVHVWSYATSLDTHVYNPTFSLATNSTATDNTQIVANLVTVAIAVASSSVAVVVGGYVQGWVKRRNKAILTRSLMVAYATRVLEELPNVLSFFQFLSYASWDEDSMRMMPLLTKKRTLDTSIYDPRIRDNLLFLKEKLANDVTYFDMLIRMINDSVEYCLIIITSSQPEALSKWSQLRKENSSECSTVRSQIHPDFGPIQNGIVER